MDPFERFYPYVEAGIPGLPEPVLRRAIRDASIEVMAETGFIRAYLPAAVNLVLNQNVYTIQSPQPDTQICDIERMVDGTGNSIGKRERDWIENRYKTWEVDIGAQALFFFITEIADAGTTFQIYPIPNAASTPTNLTALTIRCTLCPTDVARYLPPDAYHLMRQTIKSAALRELFGLDSMNWHNEQAAAKHAAIALKGKQDLRVQREFGWGKTVPVVQTGALGMWDNFDSAGGGSNGW